jgi:hypothetical protein
VLRLGEMLLPDERRIELPPLGGRLMLRLGGGLMLRLGEGEDGRMVRLRLGVGEAGRMLLFRLLLEGRIVRVGRLSFRLGVMVRLRLVGTLELLGLI